MSEPFVFFEILINVYCSRKIYCSKDISEIQNFVQTFFLNLNSVARFLWPIRVTNFIVNIIYPVVHLSWMQMNSLVFLMIKHSKGKHERKHKMWKNILREMLSVYAAVVLEVVLVYMCYQSNNIQWYFYQFTISKVSLLLPSRLKYSAKICKGQTHWRYVYLRYCKRTYKSTVASRYYI